MTVKIISRRLNPKDITIKLVDGSTIRGKVNLWSDEHMIMRVSDIFTKIPDPFITIFDATIGEKKGRVAIINKNNIAWVVPEEVMVPIEPEPEPEHEEEKPR